MNVTELMRQGLGILYSKLMDDERLSHNSEVYFNRANAIFGIKDIDLHVDEVTGEDKTIDVVIFLIGSTVVEPSFPKEI